MASGRDGVPLKPLRFQCGKTARALRTPHEIKWTTTGQQSEAKFSTARDATGWCVIRMLSGLKRRPGLKRRRTGVGAIPL